MNNENLTNNEEIIETVTEVSEEVAKAVPKSGTGLKVAKFGLAMLVGGLLCHYVVDPGINKVSTLIKEHKNKKNGTSDESTDDYIDSDYVEVDEEDEEEN